MKFKKLFLSSKKHYSSEMLIILKITCFFSELFVKHSHKSLQIFLVTSRMFYYSEALKTKRMNHTNCINWQNNINTSYGFINVWYVPFIKHCSMFSIVLSFLYCVIDDFGIFFLFTILKRIRWCYKWSNYTSQITL